MASDNELFRCKAGMTVQDVVTKNKHGEYQINIIWHDKSKGKLRVFDDRLEFKNVFSSPFVLPYARIHRILLLDTKIAMIRCHILWIIHDEGDCAFSLLRNKFWEGPLPFGCLRGDANAPHGNLLKEFAKGLVAGGIGEIAGGAVGDSSVASKLAGKATSSVVGHVAGEGLNRAGEQVQRMRQQTAPTKPQRPTTTPPTPPPPPVTKKIVPPLFPVGKVHPEHRYVIRHGGQESAGINKATLVRIVESGKLTTADEVWDLAKRQQIDIAKLIDKYHV